MIYMSYMTYMIYMTSIQVLGFLILSWWQFADGML